MKDLVLAALCGLVAGWISFGAALVLSSRFAIAVYTVLCDFDVWLTGSAAEERHADSRD